ncbi:MULTISPECIES: hypothetical protein [Spirulina sp. CCY15215]|nr:hypothetical protein [Spirulina major]
MSAAIAYPINGVAIGFLKTLIAAIALNTMLSNCAILGIVMASLKQH